MQTLLALARHDRHHGQRRFFGATIGLSEPPLKSGPHLWFANEASQRPGQSSVYVKSETYFDRTWALALSPGTRYKITRSQKKGLRFELKRRGDSCPLEQMLWIYEGWRKTKLFLVGYLLKAPVLSSVLTYYCVFLRRGDRLVGFGPIMEEKNFILVENFYRQ